ncbi:MAG: ATP-binding protein [Sediminibacterium sp.]|nr:ATP-binding protein [Sediminibacterium sp.]MDP3128453.1 ATP-binding protein [Sediminibacterium sp.]
MINALKKTTFKHAYLVITAAWLYTLSFIFINYWSYYSSPQKVKSQLENRLHQKERNFTAIIGDTITIASLLNAPNTTPDPLKDEVGLFIYRHINGQAPPKLHYWNTNRIYISGDDLYRKEGSYFVSYQNGDFEMIKKTIRLKSQTVTVVAMIPIRWSYFIHNKYLQADFAGFRGLDEQYGISKNSSALPINNAIGQELFRIELKPGKSFIGYDVFTVLLRVIAIIFLLVFFHIIALELVSRYQFKTGFLFLLGAVLLLRLITYLFSFPFDFSKLPLFDPSVYASNFLHPSLGDLLVNTILMYWLVSFYQSHNDHRAWFPNRFPQKLYHYLSLFIFTVICFFLATVIISLVRDSKISFDVTNIFSLTIYSVISFVILCLLVLSFFIFSQVLLRQLIKNRMPLFHQCLAVVANGFVFLLILPLTADIPVYLSVLIWLVSYLCLLNFRKNDLFISLLGSSVVIFWVMFFAMTIAALVIYENRKVEFAQRRSIAEKLASQTDPSGENLLNIATTNFDNRFLADNYFRLEGSEYANKYFKDSLINQNFSGYLNKYDTRIYTFDSLFHPLFNEDSVKYATLKTILLNQAKPTGIPGLFSYENPVEGFSYLYQKEIKEQDHILGYLFVTVKSKRYKSEALYPELFNQVQDIASDLNTNYAYAVYNNGRIINHFNTYGFPSVLSKDQIPAFEFSQKLVGNYSELWFNSGNNKQVVVVKRNTWLMESVTLFAYFFCSFLIIILLFQLGGFIVKTRFKWAGFRQMLRLTIRSQIQATIIFLSVFSFVVIAIATISFFILRFQRNNEERLSKSIQVMANEVNNKMNSLAAFDDVPDNIGVRSGLENTIAEISDLYNVDINYYNLSGNLVISTQPYIYNKHLLSGLMEPHAYAQMQSGGSIHYLQSETVGSLEYLSIYVPLADEKGNKYAYLNIPYLNSQSELNQEISGFLATLINLNAFIFLVAGGIAFFLTNRITASFSLIGKKMQEMNLGKINEEITWNQKDEIGMLVNEYNTLVKKLEISAQALAQSEREGAWREMARQVAHEIKNPLTPMKLSIQYLQNAIQRGAPNVKELSANMAVTLIEQVDQLSKIAGDFSQFANIGNAHIEQFDMDEILTSLIRLYSTNPGIQIEWNRQDGLHQILADKVQMSRLFTNLLQNAIEAGEGSGKIVKVVINQKIENDSIVFSLKDYSGGIPEGMKENIFTPNFTTKSSGTGLGLAICKGIVEKANGQIWFESEAGVGTAFYIRLPKA